LKEDMDIGTMGMGGMDSMGMTAGGIGGGPYYSPGSLKKIFVEPFTTAIGAAAGKVKEMARRAVGLVRIAFETVMTTLVPFLRDNYDEIFEKQKEDIQKIKSEYSAYSKSVDEAFENDDFKALAFIAFPGAALAGKFVQDGPEAAKKILSVATGGVSDEYLEGRGKSKKSPGSIFDSYARSYAKLLREAGEEGGGEKKEVSLADKIGSKKFIEEIMKGSPTMMSASKKARDLYRDSLEKVFKEASGVLKAKSIDEIEKVLGKKVPGTDKLKQLKPEERKRGEEELLKATRESLKKMYTKSLKDDVKKVSDVFGDDFPFVQDYNKVIAAIEKL
jgi:hypothetical protein